MGEQRQKKRYDWQEERFFRDRGFSIYYDEVKSPQKAYKAHLSQIKDLLKDDNGDASPGRRRECSREHLGYQIVNALFGDEEEKKNRKVYEYNAQRQNYHVLNESNLNEVYKKYSDDKQQKR